MTKKQTIQSCFLYGGSYLDLSEPTSDQCTAHAVLARDDKTGGVAFAAWHPQWGGSGGKCIVETGANPGDCFEVHNWHDGEFPADAPMSLHYCDPDQLIRFGELVKKMQGETPGKDA